MVVDPLPLDNRVAMFDKLGVPVVTIGRDVARAEGPWWVAADSAGSTAMVLDHLAEAGARSIAMLSVDIGWSWFADAQQTYREWTADKGTEPILVLARPDKLETSAVSAAAEILDHRHDAVYVPPQWLVPGLLLVAGAWGRRARRPAGLRRCRQPSGPHQRRRSQRSTPTPRGRRCRPSLGVAVVCC
ncbi:hypothetical protein [Nonomuraea recticatena]